MKKLILFIIFFIQINLFAQKTSTPKLVVGIVVDQMRYDYLIKFQKNFTKGGLSFKRILQKADLINL